MTVQFILGYPQKTGVILIKGDIQQIVKQGEETHMGQPGNASDEDKTEDPLTGFDGGKE